MENANIIAELEHVRDRLLAWAQHDTELAEAMNQDLAKAHVLRNQASQYDVLAIEINGILDRIISDGLPPGKASDHKRYRINVSTTNKGVKSYDATVEIQSPSVSLSDTLREVDAMIEEMDARVQSEG